MPRTGYAKIVTVAVLVTWLCSGQIKTHADSLSIYVIAGSGAVILISSAFPDNGSTSDEQPLYSGSLSQFQALSPRALFESEQIELGLEMKAPLFAETSNNDSRTRRMEAEKKRQAKKRFVGSVVQMAEKTAFWEKIKELEKSVSDSLTFEYFKRVRQDQGERPLKLPKSDLQKDRSAMENGIGIALSPVVEVDRVDNFGVATDLIFFDTIFNTEYQYSRSQITLEVSNSKLDDYLDATASIGVMESTSSTSFIFKLRFDF